MKYALAADPGTVVSPREIRARIDALERMPAFLRDAVAGRTDDELRARPAQDADGFSLHEHAWHLRDLEVIGYSRRIRAVVADESTFLPDVDGTKLASERGYSSLPLADALADFERERAANVAFLRGLPFEAFERRGDLEGVGCISLAGLLERWCDHDRVHRSEIDALRGG